METKSEVKVSPTHMVSVVCPACLHCGKSSAVTMPVEAYAAWRSGGHIQNVWPEGSESDRELLISGTHAACWDILFPDEEEE